MNLRILLLTLLLSYSFLSSQAQSAERNKRIKLDKFLSLQIGAGISYYTFQDTDDDIIASHNDKWREAINFNALIGYHPSEDWLIALAGSYLTSDSRTNGIQITLPSGVYSGYLEDNVELYHVSLEVSRSLIDIYTYDFGYHFGADLFYLENNGRLIVDDFSLTGTDLGFHLGLNGAFELSRTTSIQLKVQYLINIVSDPQYEVVDQKIPVLIPDQDMSRFEAALAFRYTFLRKRKRKQATPQQKDDYVPNRRFE